MTDFVYLTSANYSGSTLLTFLLNTHPGITTIGELKGGTKDPEKHRCSCGSAIGCCPFWSKILDRLHAKNIPFRHEDVWSQCGFRIPNATLANRVVRHDIATRPFELARDLFMALSPACRRELPRIRRTNEAFVQAAMAVANSSVFLDSSKDPIRLKHLYRVRSFRTKVLHLVRDGRGVTNSAIKRRKVTAAQAAKEWLLRELEIKRMLAPLAPQNHLLIRYEDLCIDPDAELTRICTFLGLSSKEIQHDFLAVEHHILGNTMRFDSTSTIRADTKWKEEMQHEQIETFERIGGSLNRSYGHDGSTSASSPTASSLQGQPPPGGECS